MPDERALWAAVIKRAIKDAAGEIESGFVKATTRAYFIQNAQSWFRNADEGFQAICDAADLEPNRVRAYALTKFIEVPKVGRRRLAA